MKLKPLVAIASGVLVALTLSIPSIAETVIKSETIGIGNKDYRNKQFSPSIVGTWKSEAHNNEYRTTDIFLDINSDGTVNIAFKRPNQNATFSNVNYEYESVSDNKGIWREKNRSGNWTSDTIEWFSSDEFVITLEQLNNGNREGIQRRYVRTKGSVVSSLRGAPQPTTTTTDYSGLNNAIDDYNKTRVLNQYRLPKY